MNDYYLMNSLDTDMPSNVDDQPSAVTRRYYENSTNVVSVRPQSRCLNQNNPKSLTWNILLTDDQDEVSEHLLRMNSEPISVPEKFGPAILTVPENIRKQADKLFTPLEINPNEIFDFINKKVSWILPSSYQQYLKSIPQNILDKRERHVLYPWTQWNTSTGTRFRPSPNSVVTSPSVSDRSFSSSLSSSSSSLYAHAVYGRSPKLNNSSNNNSFGYSSGGVPITTATDTSSACSELSPFGAQCTYWTVHPTMESMSPQQKIVTCDGRGGLQQLSSWSQTTAVRSPSDCGRSVSSADLSYGDRSPPQLTAGAQVTAVTTAVRWPSRLYYCVNTDSNTINKLVEHYCTFCYKNHEPPEVYGSHLVRDDTRTTCPKLRALRCKHCNGTGDNAHTIKYCPFLYANYS